MVTARVAVEAAASLGGERYVGGRGAIGMNTFGVAAALKHLKCRLGLGSDNAVPAAGGQIVCIAG